MAGDVTAPERIPDETVWAVCPYMDGHGLADCERCPEWEEEPGHGRVKRGCRMMAEEVCRIACAAPQNGGSAIAVAALDALALALTDHGHHWSDEQRGLYEAAIAVLVPEIEEAPDDPA